MPDARADVRSGSSELSRASLAATASCLAAEISHPSCANYFAPHSTRAGGGRARNSKEPRPLGGGGKGG